MVLPRNTRVKYVIKHACLSLSLSSLTLAFALAVQADAQTAPTGQSRSEVAAKVGQQKVYAKDVTRLLSMLTKNRKLPSQSLPQLHAETLEQIVRQRLVQIRLKRLGKLASREMIESELKKQEDRLSAQKRTLDEVLAARGITMPEYRRDLRWELSWKKFSTEEIADEQLEAYFKQHRPHYDGSQVRASHVLLRPIHREDAHEVAQIIGRARKLREQITAGKISFADAAKEHSDGPSASQGGDLGFFPRRGVMVESFARAAYDLQRGDVSGPVATQFGVHLIQVTDTRPGTRTWAQSREQLQTAVANGLFRQLADEEREETPVQYTGKVAHFDPETGAVVRAGATPPK